MLYTYDTGGHDSGKSTVIRALARPDSSDTSAHDSRKLKGKAVASPEDDRPDLGINFQYIDLADDGESGEGECHTPQKRVLVDIDGC